MQESFLGILPLNPHSLFHHLVPHVCPSIWHEQHEFSPVQARRMCLIMRAGTAVPSLFRATILIHRRQAPSWQFSGQSTWVKLYLSWGFLAILIAAQAPPHLTPSKVRKPEPTFPQGIPVCVGSLEKSAHRNLLYLQRWTEDQLWYIPVDWQVFYLIGSFAGPFLFLEFASSSCEKVHALNCISTHSKATEFPSAHKKSICTPEISFLLSVKYVHFM